jgi:lysophospholipase L1-like esterase
MADKVLHTHDSLLGHVPRAGAHGVVSGGGPVTIGLDGLRFSGENGVSDNGPILAPILAVGDSYTWGEDVGDMETWPAQLQRLTGRRVLNGGVTGFGFDQIVLRTERLVERHKPAVVVVSFIAEDIGRTEMRRLWWYDKPWFAIEGGELVLKGVPVPNRTVLPLRLRRRIEQVVFAFPPLLQHALGYHARVHRAGSGLAIALRLVERLVRLQATREVRIVIMAQYDPRAWIGRTHAEAQRRLTQPVLEGAARNGLATLDTFSRLAAEPRPLAFYGAMHLNARGNQVIAGLLAATLPALLGAGSVPCR